MDGNTDHTAHKISTVPRHRSHTHHRQHTCPVNITRIDTLDYRFLKAHSINVTMLNFWVLGSIDKTHNIPSIVNKIPSKRLRSLINYYKKNNLILWPTVYVHHIQTTMRVIFKDNHIIPTCSNVKSSLTLVMTVVALWSSSSSSLVSLRCALDFGLRPVRLGFVGSGGRWRLNAAPLPRPCCWHKLNLL